MSNVIDINYAIKKRRKAEMRASELVSSLEEQARPNIRIAEHLQLRALEKPFAEVLLEIEKAHNESIKNWLNKV